MRVVLEDDAQKSLNRDPKDEIMKAFRLSDDDESGQISFNNLTRVVKELGERMTDEDEGFDDSIENFCIQGFKWKNRGKEQQRITHQSKRLTTRRAQLNGGTGTTTTTDPTEQAAMNTEEREEIKSTAKSIRARVGIPESAVDNVVEQIRNDTERLTKKSQEYMGHVTNHSHDSNANTPCHFVHDKQRQQHTFH